MGRTVLPFTQELYREEESWKGFRRALRGERRTVRELSRRVEELERRLAERGGECPGGI